MVTEFKWNPETLHAAMEAEIAARRRLMTLLKSRGVPTDIDQKLGEGSGEFEEAVARAEDVLEAASAATLRARGYSSRHAELSARQFRGDELRALSGEEISELAAFDVEHRQEMKRLWAKIEKRLYRFGNCSE